MTDPFEREVKRVVEDFIADIARVAQRAAVHELLSGFARALRQTRGAVAVGEGPPRRAGARRPMIDLAAERARIVACVQKHPGSSTAGLSRSLTIHPSRLRRLLRALVDEQAVRIETSFDSLFGGQGSHRYFAVVPVQEVEPDVLCPAAGAAV